MVCSGSPGTPGLQWKMLFACLDRTEFPVGDDDLLRQMIANGASPNAKDNSGMALLCYALRKGLPALEFLLDCGANVNVTTTLGHTALTCTILRLGNNNIDETVKILRFLIARGADVNHIDHERRCPLVHLIRNQALLQDESTVGAAVVRQRFITMADILLDAGADVCGSDPSNPALAHAIRQGRSHPLLGYLLEKGPCLIQC